MNRKVLPALFLLFVLAAPFQALAQADPLPSWNDGPAKLAITTFVERVTTEGSPDFVPVEERIATFDNDGTLWVEQPVYFQVAFAFQRIKAMAADHPEWNDKQPYKAVIEGDEKALAATGEKGLLEVVAATHAGMTTDEFSGWVLDWTKTDQHPRFKRPYIELVYQPMLEVLGYLRANGFKTFIVSGGGIDFMRPWTEKVYGIPPEQVIGSSGVGSPADRRRQAELIKTPRCSSSTTAPANPSAYSSISVDGRSSPSATPTATSRCCNMCPAARERGWRSTCITTMRNANMPMTARRLSESSTRDWTRPAPKAGR